MPKNEFTTAVQDIVDEFQTSKKRTGAPAPPFMSERKKFSRSAKNPIVALYEQMGISLKEIRDG